MVSKQNHYSFAMELEKLIVLFFLVGLQLKWFVFGKANPVLILIQIWSQRNTSAQHGQMFVVKLAIELVKPWIWCPITGLYNELLSTYCQNYVIIHTTYILLGTIGLEDGIHLTYMKIGVHAHWTIQQDYRNASLTKKLLKSSITNFAPQYNNWFCYQLCMQIK